MKEHTLALAKKIQEQCGLTDVPNIKLVDCHNEGWAAELVINFQELPSKLLMETVFKEFNVYKGNKIVLSGRKNIDFINGYGIDAEKVYKESPMSYKLALEALEPPAVVKASPRIAPRAVLLSAPQQSPLTSKQIELLAKNIQEVHGLKNLPSIELKEAESGMGPDARSLTRWQGVESEEKLTARLIITLHKDDAAAAIDKLRADFFALVDRDKSTIILEQRHAIDFIQNYKIDAQKLYEEENMSTFYSSLVPGLKR